MNILISFVIGITLGICIGRRSEKSKQLEALDSNELYSITETNVKFMQ